MLSFVWLLLILWLICLGISLVCWIIVILKMLQNKMLALGLLSILFWPIAMVVGWQNAEKLRITKTVELWLGAMAALSILSVAIKKFGWPVLRAAFEQQM